MEHIKLQFITFKKIITIFIFFLTVANIAEARFMELEDAQNKYNIFNVEINVNKDGTFEKTQELEIEILKQGGRDSFINFALTYDKDTQKFEILEARTMFNGSTYEVSKKKIETKPLASSKQGFEQRMQVLVPFDKVEIGAKLYIKMKSITDKIPLKGEFEDLVTIGMGYIEKYNLSIKSEIPLSYKQNDPRGVLNIETKKYDDGKNNKKFRYIKIASKIPFSDYSINEPNNSNLSEKNSTWVSISSMERWEDPAKVFASSYAEVTNKALPKDFEIIANKAREEKNEITQINKVTTLLNEKIQYLGEWQSITGRLKPRNLEIVAKTQYGDCKDFTASTIAILNSIGYESYPLLVNRNNPLFIYKTLLPGLISFNHVIVKAIGPSKKTYWIDPTNIVSMADDLFMDVSNRKGLLLNPKNPEYIDIPNSDYKRSVTQFTREIDIKPNTMELAIDGKLSGRDSMLITAHSLYYSKEQFMSFLYSLFEDDSIPKENRILDQAPLIKEREIKDYAFKIKYRKTPDYIMTNYGNGLEIYYNNVLPDLTYIPNRSVNDIFIGNPSTFIRTTILKNKKIKNITHLNTNLNTKWISLNRKAQIVGKNTEITDRILILESVIENEELKESEFKKLQNHIKTYYKNPVIILK